jgi:hypothetical protein
MQQAQNVARLRRYFCGDKKCDTFGQAFGDQAKIARALAPGGKGKVFRPDCDKPILLRDVIEENQDRQIRETRETETACAGSSVIERLKCSRSSALFFSVFGVFRGLNR